LLVARLFFVVKYSVYILQSEKNGNSNKNIKTHLLDLYAIFDIFDENMYDKFLNFIIHACPYLGVFIVIYLS